MPELGVFGRGIEGVDWGTTEPKAGCRRVPRGGVGFVRRHDSLRAGKDIFMASRSLDLLNCFRTVWSGSLLW